jgi:protein-S-isoprenylcysteine O-methyltransferase Ste14
MPIAADRQSQAAQKDPGWFSRLGGWLFLRRTTLPVPIILALLILPPQSLPAYIAPLGIVIILLAETLRLWAVRQIGVISRTRRDRLGPLVTSGPFALVRNPLYLGNIALWVGFTLAARLVYFLPVVLFGLGLAYHAIVLWEEQLLETRRGEAYRQYAAETPRWLPMPRRVAKTLAEPFSWSDTLYSERGTLLGIAAGGGLLYLKQLLIGD